MKILIVGSGGREHALAWKINKSPKCSTLFIAPGNAGTALVGKNINARTGDEILGWLRKNLMDLVIIGPDSHLADGLADQIQELSIAVFGPTKLAAEIEWSKSFAKRLMQEEGIPTAKFETFTNFGKAATYVREQKMPIVIKANGLAFGKGVTIAKTADEAIAALNDLMQDATFGAAGTEVVIEELLEGREISIHAFSDGDTVQIFPASQDHKRIYDNDDGPNTGGMGAIAPVPWVTQELMNEIRETIVIPCINGLKKRDRSFTGVLYPGIMVTKEGPKVIEFNARFGDPETQVYMPLLKTDIVDIMLACIHKTLATTQIEWAPGSACCVVLASGGYPGSYATGKVIAGLSGLHDTALQIFHAGTALQGTDIVTNGGRVLGITTIGKDLSAASAAAYTAVNLVSFESMHYRKDIGAKSIQTI